VETETILMLSSFILNLLYLTIDFIILLFYIVLHTLLFPVLFYRFFILYICDFYFFKLLLTYLNILITIILLFKLNLIVFSL